MPTDHEQHEIEFGKQRLVHVRFAPKADIRQPEWHVRYVPEADFEPRSE